WRLLPVRRRLPRWRLLPVRRLSTGLLAVLWRPATLRVRVVPATRWRLLVAHESSVGIAPHPAREAHQSLRVR
ncbi:MAG: hypothetical protein ACRDO7_01175, partial [Nocardioidaceae bacterium]